MKLKGIIALLAVVCLLSACTNNENQSPVNKQVEDEVYVTEEMNEVISNYIVQKYASVSERAEKLIEVHSVYGASEADGIITVYMHSYFGGFNKATGLENQAGHSMPVVIRLKQNDSGYGVIKYTEPKDGSRYTDSLKKMFPEPYLERVWQSSANIEELRREMDRKVQRWLEESQTSANI